MTANPSPVDRPFSEYSTLKASQIQEPKQILQVSTVSQPLELPTSKQLSSSFKHRSDDDQSALIPVSVEDTKNNRAGLLDPDLSNLSLQDIVQSQGNIEPATVATLEKDVPFRPHVDASVSAVHSLIVPDQVATSPQGTLSREPDLHVHPPPGPSNHKSSLEETLEVGLPRWKEQRNETYQIKHFNWFDFNSRTLRRSSMLTQNKNGPCPLLALVNALILGAESDSRSALGTALRTREQVSLGLIIESLIDELTSEGRGGHLTELPDVDELNRFLLMLHTGMNANPRLVSTATSSPNLMYARNSSLDLPLSLNSDQKPGTFEDTRDMRLYGAFGIPLVHGWLAPRTDPASAAFARSAQTYEDAQTIQFREEELEEKLSTVGLTPEEQQLLQDISCIKSFLESYPTQITPYGLDIINESLFPGSAAILFRNDHFSSIYKHPESSQLFTLVTDAGYSDRDEVIWESLVDVSGQNSEFFSGDFRPVSSADQNNQPQQKRSDDPSANPVTQWSAQPYDLGLPTPSQEQQQQADADFAMALQLQEEEETRVDDSRRRSDVNDVLPDRNPRMSNPNRVRGQDAIRPTIPPRNLRSQGVNRPVGSNLDEAPPPAYEEAAKTKPYLPPTGHPQHSSFDGRSSSSSPSTIPHLPDPQIGLGGSSRMSGFPEDSQFQTTPPLARPHSHNIPGVVQSSGRPRDKEKDCVVM